MPEEVIDEGNCDPGSRAFQPMLPPDHLAFEQAMKMDEFDIVTSRQVHSENHNPTCFKYGLRKCRFRFPRALAPRTVFDETTGVILQQRDHQWLNNYNRWFSLIMRTNHDCQYLFTQIHALAIIHYTMKYISKAEENTHSKLTIAAAVAKALTIAKPNGQDHGKSMLIKTYNRLSSHREVGIPEALSHLLNYPDALTDAIFQSVHTTHLLNHLKSLNNGQDDLTPMDLGESTIIQERGTPTLLSLFDNYANRGPGLADMCLYDYASLVYKSRNYGGIPFDPEHPQHRTYRQFVRRDAVAIPTLLGKLLFLRPDSEEQPVRNNYFCLLSGLFTPWSQEHPPVKSVSESWEVFFSDRKDFLSPRILRYIDNLALLHKSKEEAEIDRLQLFAQSAQDRENGDTEMTLDRFEMMGLDDQDWDNERDDMTRSLALVQSSLECSLESLDNYVREAMVANFENGYFDNSLGSSLADSETPSFDFHEPSHGPIFEAVDAKVVRKLLKDAKYLDEIELQRQDNEYVEPDMFLTGSDIASIIRDFSLNTEQSRALKIICNHAAGRHLPDDAQLLMGVFGAGGTGKSTLIEAIRLWFKRNGREKELIVTATTGSAAVKVKGRTVHAAASIPIERSDGKKLGGLKKNQVEAWGLRRYMIIDEVSMLDCQVMCYLHKQLSIAKANPEVAFGGVNIIFFGDFLQLPAVVNPDLYVDNKDYPLGHQLWRSLNAVVILTQQMRQAGDPEYAALLSRLRVREPTDEDIETLNDRIGAELPNMESVAVTVRRHALRQAINMQRMRELESKSDTRITYCIGNLAKRHNISAHEAYQIQFGEHGSPVDAILPLLPGVPLMVTQNINQTLGMKSSPHFTD